MKLKHSVWLAAALLLCGCSARDPLNKTPSFHVGTPTNRSSTYSWVPHNEPFYVQPGLNSGKAIPPIKAVPSQLRFEPYDPSATAVYNQIKGSGVDITYITTKGRNGVVVIDGSVLSRKDEDKAIASAKTVAGVKQIVSHLRIQQ